MASVNKVIIVGNLGRDPEVRYSPDGAAITNAAIATSYQWKDKATGDKKEETEWHRVVFFGRLGEIAGEYLVKGSSVYIEGRLRTRKWTDKDGVEKYATEVVAESLQMLGKPASSSGQRGQGRDDGAAPAPAQRQQSSDAQPRNGPQKPIAKGTGSFNDMDDDIPF